MLPVIEKPPRPIPTPTPKPMDLVRFRPQPVVPPEEAEKAYRQDLATLRLRQTGREKRTVQAATQQVGRPSSAPDDGLSPDVIETMRRADEAFRAHENLRKIRSSLNEATDG